jgi:hypothetical protein
MMFFLGWGYCGWVRVLLVTAVRELAVDLLLLGLVLELGGGTEGCAGGAVSRLLWWRWRRRRGMRWWRWWRLLTNNPFGSLFFAVTETWYTHHGYYRLVPSSPASPLKNTHTHTQFAIAIQKPAFSAKFGPCPTGFLVQVCISALVNPRSTTMTVVAGCCFEGREN